VSKQKKTRPAVSPEFRDQAHKEARAIIRPWLAKHGEKVPSDMKEAAKELRLAVNKALYVGMPMDVMQLIVVKEVEVIAGVLAEISSGKYALTPESVAVGAPGPDWPRD
jgi:hypothetical protein